MRDAMTRTVALDVDKMPAKQVARHLEDDFTYWTTLRGLAAVAVHVPPVPLLCAHYLARGYSARETAQVLCASKDAVNRAVRVAIRAIHRARETNNLRPLIARGGPRFKNHYKDEVAQHEDNHHTRDTKRSQT